MPPQHAPKCPGRSTPPRGFSRFGGPECAGSMAASDQANRAASEALARSGIGLPRRRRASAPSRSANSAPASARSRAARNLRSARRNAAVSGSAARAAAQAAARRSAGDASGSPPAASTAPRTAAPIAAQARSRQRRATSGAARAAAASARSAARRDRRSSRLLATLQLAQATIEIGGFDGAHHRLDDAGELRCLGRGDLARGGGAGDRPHRAGEIGGAGHRRHGEPHRPPAARRGNTVEAQPQRDRIAREGKLDRLAGQGLGLAFEQQLGNAIDLVTAPARPPGRVAGDAFGERTPAGTGPLILLFYQCVIRQAGLLDETFGQRDIDITSCRDCQYHNTIIASTASARHAGKCRFRSGYAAEVKAGAGVRCAGRASRPWPPSDRGKCAICCGTERINAKDAEETRRTRRELGAFAAFASPWQPWRKRAPGAEDNALARRTQRKREGRGGSSAPSRPLRLLRGLCVECFFLGSRNNAFNAKDAEETRRTRRELGAFAGFAPPSRPPR